MRVATAQPRRSATAAPGPGASRAERCRQQRVGPASAVRPAIVGPAAGGAALFQSRLARLLGLSRQRKDRAPRLRAWDGRLDESLTLPSGQFARRNNLRIGGERNAYDRRRRADPPHCGKHRTPQSHNGRNYRRQHACGSNRKLQRAPRLRCNTASINRRPIRAVERSHRSRSGSDLSSRSRRATLSRSVTSLRIKTPSSRRQNMRLAYQFTGTASD